MADQRDLFDGGLAEATRPGGAADRKSTGPDLRLGARGIDDLGDAATLERLLARCLPAGANVPAAAGALLARFGGVGRVLGAPSADLAAVAGWGVATELAMLHALLLRVLELPVRQRDVLSSWEAVSAYLRVRLSALPREAVHVLFLDKKNQLIADERMGEGTVDHAPLYPREIMRRALELSASALVIAHNHPSGDPTPSQADVDVTKAVMAAGKALGITVHDHLVVASDRVVSLRGSGLI